MQKLYSPVYFIGISVAILLTAIAFIVHTQDVFGAQTNDQSTRLEHHYIPHTFFTATTTNATSTLDATEDPNSVGMDIKGAKHVNLIFGRGDTTGTGNSGSSRFNIQVSPDAGSTWIDYNVMFQNLATSTDPFLTSSVSLTGTSTVMVSMSKQLMGFDRLRCIVVETTDGNHTCKAAAEF